MTTKIVDTRPKPQLSYAHALKLGAKFDFNGNIFMVTGSKGDKIQCVHLVTGDTHYIDDDQKIEIVSVEIKVSKWTFL